MDVVRLTQRGPSWPRERAWGRGGIRKNCGKVWKTKNPACRTGTWDTRRNVRINEKADKRNMHYVMLEGTFDASNQGHLGLKFGTITNIALTTICPTAEP